MSAHVTSVVMTASFWHLMRVFLGILYNLRKRHSYALPYTYTGRIVIAVNPFRWLPQLYDHKTQATYVNAVESDVRDSLAPHVYSISATAIAEVKKGKGQSILVSGESGAGKTETVKILISHLAFISSEMGGGCFR